MKTKRNDKRMKQILVVLIVGFMISLGSAAWYFGFTTEITGQITGGEDYISVSYEFEDFSLLTETSANSTIEELRLENDNGNSTMLVFLNISSIPDDWSCPNFEDDCSVELISKDYGGLLDGSNFTLVDGFNDFNLSTSCVKRSCPQNLTIQVEFTEL